MFNQKLNANGQAIYANRCCGGEEKGSFYPEFEKLVVNSQFEEVRSYIELENLSRGELDKLCVDNSGNIRLYEKNLLQYIINYRSKITITPKAKIKILDIEPANGSHYRPITTAEEDAKVSDDILTEYDAYKILRSAHEMVQILMLYMWPLKLYICQQQNSLVIMKI